jgi:hypothetical protein
MDPITHTIIAVGCMVAAYFAGRYVAVKQQEDIFFAVLEKWQKEGLITKSETKES